MSRTYKIGAAASAVVFLFSAGVLAVRAQEAAQPAAEAAAQAADPAAVVARVGDTEVTEADLAYAAEAFEGELANVPEPQKRSVILDAFVNMRLLALAAEDAGIDKTDDFAKRLHFQRLQALRNEYVREKIIEALTDEEMKKAYQTLVVEQHTPQEEVHARHILVETKEAAQKIIDDVKGGASFEELAKQSKDPSGQNGGDLGFFGKGQMVPEFEQAAFALEAGQMTQEPVQSQFGWHVIKVEEKRMSEAPSFQEVEPQLRNYVMREKFTTAITALRDKYPVEIVGQEDAPEEPAAESPAEAPAEGGEGPAAAPQGEAPKQ
jgi:peptidyl-prolyl cis-trans isomerase C